MLTLKKFVTLIFVKYNGSVCNTIHTYLNFWGTFQKFLLSFSTKDQLLLLIFFVGVCMLPSTGFKLNFLLIQSAVGISQFITFFPLLNNVFPIGLWPLYTWGAIADFFTYSFFIFLKLFFPCFHFFFFFVLSFPI